MSIRIGAALRDGARRTFTREGLVLAVGFVVVGAVSAVASQTVLAHVFDSILEAVRTQQAAGNGDLTPSDIDTLETIFDAWTPLALPVSASVGGVLIVLTGVVAEALHLVAARVFFANPTGVRTAERLRPIALPTLNGIVGGVVIAFLVGLGGVLGLILVIVGGPIVALFLAMSFLFLRQEIAVENKNFIDALNDSWSLARGNRVELFFLVLVVVIVTTLASVVLTAILGLFSPVVGAVVGFLVGGVTAVFGTAVVTRAYAQLRAEERSDDANERAAVY